MKEIKFKYMWQDVRNKKNWASFFYTLDEIETKKPYHDVSGIDDLRFYRLKHRLQYTGLKDNNGKEIYEGDIVIEAGQNGLIVFNEESARFEIISKLDARGMYGFFGKIIGNKFENPELELMEDLDEEWRH